MLQIFVKNLNIIRANHVKIRVFVTLSSSISTEAEVFSTKRTNQTLALERVVHILE